MPPHDLNSLLAGHFHVHDEYSPLDGLGNRNQLSYAAVQAGQTHLGFTNHGRLGGALEHVHACRHPEKYDNPLDPSQTRSKDERLMPILGCEVFFRRDRTMELTRENTGSKNPHNWAHHLCVHAASLDGWRTLMRLSSKSWVRRERGGGYYGKPIVDHEMLTEDHKDLVVSTACMSSPLSWFILNGDERGARRFIRKMEKVSKNGIVWFELMPHNLDAQREINIECANLAYDMGHPVIATGDVHIPFQGWETAHEVVRMATYKQTFASRREKEDAGEDTYTERIDTVFLSSGEEMFAQFQKYHPELPEETVREAMSNTHEFARQFRWYVISKVTKAPRVDVDAKVEVRKWVDDGWSDVSENYPAEHWRKWPEKVYRDRFAYEFDVLENKGVLPYFYIVGDFVRWAKSDLGLPALNAKGKVKRKTNGDIVYEGNKRPIRVGLGRGSAAGSLVSYLIGITAVDPIPHKLLFERFLNPDREGYPDIDIDFETEMPVIEMAYVDEKGEDKSVWLDGRECVKEYLKRMYGADHVVDIIAYQTFAPRVAIRDIGNVFNGFQVGHPDNEDDAPKYSINNHFLSAINETIGDTDRGLSKLAAGNPDKGIDSNEKLAGLRDDYPDLWDCLLKIEDQILRDTRHAGGVVITPKPTNHYIPTQIAADDITTVTAWADRADFPVMSDYGFLKYDILGVKALSKQETACHLIEEHYDEHFEPNDLPALRDPDAVEQEVIDSFVKGLTFGTFQFQGRQITQLLRHIRPDNITDISIANALFRPGPIAIAFEYGDRKKGKVPITFWHDSLEPVLGETLGLMCFQEQAMEVSKQIGNFTGGQADALRKAMSKLYRIPGDKAQEYMQTFYEQWMKGTHENGIREGDANVIWYDHFLPLGNYLFNRSHSSSYGLQAYQDQHLKVHYPLAFYSATFTVHKKQKAEEQREWLRSGLREARVFDIEATPPEINSSGMGWTIDGSKLRYGLNSVKGIGSSVAKEVVDRRPYRSFQHFLGRLPTNLGSDKVAALARAGAFDEFEARPYLLSRTRQWDQGVAKFKIKMSCGHSKSKTIKLESRVAKEWLEFAHPDVTDISEKLELVIENEMKFVKCKTKGHEDAVIEEVKRLDDNYEVARWYKEHDEGEPEVIWTPSDIEIADMELEALNVSLAPGAIATRYKAFMDELIFTEEDVEALPRKPKINRKSNLHGGFCKCDECEAAECVVGGEVVNIRTILTKTKKEEMAFVEFAWGANTYDCVFFPYVWKQYHRLIKRPTVFLVGGHKDQRDTRSNILVTEIMDAVDVAQKNGWNTDNLVSLGGRRQAKKLKRKAA